MTTTKYLQSSVWRLLNCWPPPPLPLASVSSTRTKGGGNSVHTRRAMRGWGGGQYFGRRQTLDWPLTVESLYDDNEEKMMGLWNSFFCFVCFLDWLECVGHFFAYVACFCILRDVWIRTVENAGLYTNLAAHLLVKFLVKDCSSNSFFVYFWQARVWWPTLFLCRPFYFCRGASALCRTQSPARELRT